jgi:hypothetical protein
VNALPRGGSATEIAYAWDARIILETNIRFTSHNRWQITETPATSKESYPTFQLEGARVKNPPAKKTTVNASGLE